MYVRAFPLLLLAFHFCACHESLFGSRIQISHAWQRSRIHRWQTMVSREEDDTLKLQIETYILAFDDMQARILGEVKVEIANTQAARKDAYEKAGMSKWAESANDIELESRLARLEASSGAERLGGHEGKVGRSLSFAKHFFMDIVDKQEGWSQWKSDVQDYCEEEG